MTHRLLQPHFFLRALRAQARYACRRATRASALRAHGTHLCELSDNHSSSGEYATKGLVGERILTYLPLKLSAVFLRK